MNPTAAAEEKITKCFFTTRSKSFPGAPLKPPKAVPREGANISARFGPDGITICDPNRANEGADKVFQRIYEKPI